MVAVLPEIDPAGIYSPGETVKLLGIGSTTLHRYATSGLIKAVRRPGSSRRLYVGQDIINLHRIVY